MRFKQNSPPLFLFNLRFRNQGRHAKTAFSVSFLKMIERDLRIDHNFITVCNMEKRKFSTIGNGKGWFLRNPFFHSL